MKEPTPLMYLRHELRIEKVPHKTAQAFYAAWHYAKGVSNAAMSYGVFCVESEELLCCVSFNAPCSENVRASVFGAQYKDHVTELGRVAVRGGGTSGSASQWSFP